MQTNIKKAVLLAAGRGTRMRDLTEALPKPMLEVRGKPVLQHIVEGLRDNGLTSLLIVVGWRGEVVKEFFGDDPFLLSYGDILIAPENYRRIRDALAGAEAVVSVKRSDDVSQGGAVFVNEKFELTDLREKPKPGEPTSPWYNAGVYAFQRSIFDYIAKLEPSPRGEYELTDAIRHLALAGRKVQALELVGSWVDVRDA